MKNAREKTFESQASMIIGAARNASIENPSKICYTLSELSNYVNKDLSGYSGSVLLDRENKVNKIWLSKEPYIINGSVEEEIEVIELAQYQEASETCEDIEILACSEEPSSYTLVINPDGGIHDGKTTNEAYEIEKNGTKAINEPYKVGYAFDGWEITGEPGSFVDGLFVMGEENVVIRAKWITLFTYTGASTLIDDGDGNWRIKFLTSGTFTPSKAMTVDIFCVGGGGAGISRTIYSIGAGAGGYTTTVKSVILTGGTAYVVVVGAGGQSPGSSGGQTSFGGAVCLTYGGGGGSGGGGGTGGSGGGVAHSWSTQYAGGSDGGYGGGYGQGTTTREFGEASGTLYSGGGGANDAVAGDGGGGSYATPNGTDNLGGGGYTNISGAWGKGGSGIVIVRNHR